MIIQWSAQSKRDLKAIKDFISRDSEFYAQQQLTRIIQRVEYISAMPTMGHPVHEHPDAGLRETHEGNYRIIYSFDEASLHVVTIVHMKQMLKRGRLR